mgnify:CR=1 FL=1
MSTSKRTASSPDGQLTLFTDWYSVWPGSVGFDQDQNGHLMDAPQGVRLAVQQAEVTDAVLKPDRPWEDVLGYASVLRSDSGFKMWYHSTAIMADSKTNGSGNETEFDPMAGKFASVPKKHLVCYAESKDGHEWFKPELGRYEFRGSTNNNILFECKHFDSVFLDREGKFRLLYHGEPIPGGNAQWKTMRSMVSENGIDWTPCEAAVTDLHADTQNVGFYDRLLDKYVCYVRYARGAQRRAMAMTEGTDFHDMPHPRMALDTDPADPPTMDIYTNAYSRHPDYEHAHHSEDITHKMGKRPIAHQHDARDMHYMFPAMYHRDRDVLDIQLAVSRDGQCWKRPERKPVIPLGAGGDRNESTLCAFPGLHVLAPDTWGVMFSASSQLHNTAFTHPNQKTDATYHWATWKKNRLVALEAQAEGRCTVQLSGCAKKQLRLNYRTAPGGWIRVELITKDGLWPPTGPTPKPGYSFAECEPLQGDSLSQTVTWNGKSQLPPSDDEPYTVIRLHMMRAKLFAIEWE